MSTLATCTPANPMPNGAPMTETQTDPMVQVKALGWREWPGNVSYTSDSGVGEYVVETGKDGEWCVYRPCEDDPFDTLHTLDAAKAAAQADFERRVLACLRPVLATLADETLQATLDQAGALDRAWRDLVEKDDRTSPEDYPDMALITLEELAEYMALAVRTALAAVPAVPDGRTEEVEPWRGPDTAPKDGNPFLAWVRDESGECLWTDVKWTEDGWQGRRFLFSVYVVKPEILAWMPRPSAPKFAALSERRT